MTWVAIAIMSALLAGFAGWYTALAAIPSFESEKLWRAMYRQRMRTNLLTFARLIRAPHDIVPLTNADMISRAAIYDLVHGPIVFEADVPANLEYWSVSVFARNTDTIFVANDRATGGGQFRLLVRRSGQHSLEPVDAETVSPSRRGFLLVRAVLRDRSEQADVEHTLAAVASAEVRMC